MEKLTIVKNIKLSHITLLRMIDGPVQKLDIDNFESVLTNTSSSLPKFVLTSPRSLEACSKLKIKPIEILPSRFFEHGSNNHDDLSRAERELERQMKILKIRLERLKIMKGKESAKVHSQSNSHQVHEFLKQKPVVPQLALEASHKVPTNPFVETNDSFQTTNEVEFDFKKFSTMHDELAKLKAQENQILRSYLEKKIAERVMPVQNEQPRYVVMESKTDQNLPNYNYYNHLNVDREAIRRAVLEVVGEVQKEKVGKNRTRPPPQPVPVQDDFQFVKSTQHLIATAETTNNKPTLRRSETENISIQPKNNPAQSVVRPPPPSTHLVTIKPRSLNPNRPRTEDRLKRNRENYEKIKQANDDYIKSKLAKSVESLNKANSNKEKKLEEKSQKIFEDYQLKTKKKEEILKAQDEERIAKTIAYLTKEKEASANIAKRQRGKSVNEANSNEDIEDDNKFIF